MKLTAWGLGFVDLGLGFEVLGLGFEVLGLGFEVLGLGFEVWVWENNRTENSLGKTRRREFLVKTGTTNISNIF